MLFPVDDGFVDVVHELPYKDVLTVRASSKDALKVFKDLSCGEILIVPHHIYTHIVHVARPMLESQFNWKFLTEVEKIERITPEPVAFAYEYVWESEDGRAWGEYGYCWPHEIASTTDSIMSSDENVIGEPTFVPLFHMPRELVGGPIPFDLDGDVEITLGEPEDD